MCSVVVGELCHRKYLDPVILLVTNVTSEVLFEDLINSFGLPIGLRVESGRQVYISIENLHKCSLEMRDGLRFSIQGDVLW